MGGAPSSPSAPRAGRPRRTLSLARPDGLSLHGYHWACDGVPRMRVFLGHSHVVHAGQMEPFALGLTRQGCDVVAFDMRGHGRSTNRANPPMHMDPVIGWDRAVDDFLAAADLAFAQTPIGQRMLIMPNILSLIALEAIKRRPDLAGHVVLIAPPPNQVLLGRLGSTFTAARARLRDPAAPDEHILHHVYAYLGSHLPEREHLLDVMSPDREVIARVLADPLCWRVPTTAYWQGTFKGLASAWTFPRDLRVDPATRFLILYGEEDPMTRNGAFCASMLKALRKLAPAEASSHGVAGARSGMFMEEDRLALSRQIMTWATGGRDDAPPVPAPNSVIVRPDSAPLSAAEFVALCYAGVQDETRWVELLMRLMVTLSDREGDDFDHLLNEMMPYWDQAFSLHQRLLTGAALGEVWSDILERIGMACAIVDRSGTILHRNAGFETALRNLAPGPAAPLDRIAQALMHSVRDAPGAQGAVVTWEGAPVGVFFQPPSLTRHARQLGNPVGVICLRQADDLLDASALYGVAWGLSPQEARVAVEVARGRSPAGIAEELGVSVNTVRSHLARCFDKTDTASQSELAAFLNRSALTWFAGPSRPATPGLPAPRSRNLAE